MDILHSEFLYYVLDAALDETQGEGKYAPLWRRGVMWMLVSRRHSSGKMTRCHEKSMRVLPRTGCPDAIGITTGFCPELSLRCHLQTKEAKEGLCLFPSLAGSRGLCGLRR